MRLLVGLVAVAIAPPVALVIAIALGPVIVGVLRARLWARRVRDRQPARRDRSAWRVRRESGRSPPRRQARLGGPRLRLRLREPRLRQQQLPVGDPALGEARLAVREVEVPQPPEAAVVAERGEPSRAR